MRVTSSQTSSQASKVSQIAAYELVLDLPQLTGTDNEVASARGFRVAFVKELQAQRTGDLRRASFWEIFENETAASFWIDAHGFRTARQPDRLAA